VFGNRCRLREVTAREGEEQRSWQSLLAFNIAAEIGQLTIILIAWPALLLLRKLSEPAWHYGRIGLASACIAVAAIWTGQRIVSVVGVLGNRVL
jgi:hypothetical protein